jgi:hypothetical protein
LFSEISKNWAGEPLRSYETILKFIRTTTTDTGLRVRSYLVRKQYQTGIKISKQQMAELQITQHKLFPRWNYTISPA